MTLIIFFISSQVSCDIHIGSEDTFKCDTEEQNSCSAHAVNNVVVDLVAKFFRNKLVIFDRQTFNIPSTRFIWHKDCIRPIIQIFTITRVIFVKKLKTASLLILFLPNKLSDRCKTYTSVFEDTI